MSTGGFLSVVKAVVWRNLHNFFTNRLCCSAVVFPLFFFTAFAGGLSRIDSVPGFHFPPGYTAFEYAFVLLQASAFGGVHRLRGGPRLRGGFARRMLLAAPRRRAVLAAIPVSGLEVGAVHDEHRDRGGLHRRDEDARRRPRLVGLYTLAVLVNISAVLYGCGVAMRFRTFQAAPADGPGLPDALPRSGLRAARPALAVQSAASSTRSPPSSRRSAASSRTTPRRWAWHSRRSRGSVRFS